MVTEEIAGESAKRGGEPREGVRGRGRKRQGPAGLPALRPGMTSRTSVLVMPGRGTLARRNGRVWAGRCGRRRRTGEGVPSSDNSSAAEGSSGARVDRGNARCRLLRQASLEAALSRARTTSGWALTLGRARILRSASRLRGTWRNATDAFGRQRNAGITASSPMNGSSARMPDRREFGTTAGLARFHRSRVALKRTQAWG